MVKVNTHARTQRYGEPAYNTSQKHHRITPTNHLSAMGAEIVLRLSMRAFRLPLLPPFFFLSLPPLFYLTLACTNYSIEEVREDRGGGGEERFVCSPVLLTSALHPRDHSISDQWLVMFVRPGPMAGSSSARTRARPS